MKVHVLIMAVMSRILIILCVLITLQCTTSTDVFINNQNLRQLYENSLNRLHITSNTTIFFAFVQTNLQSNILFRDVANLLLQFVFTNFYCTDRNGFVFINITGLEIKGMMLNNCGMRISQSLIQEALTVQTNSNYQLLEGLRAAIFAVNVHDLLIEFSNVNGSHGYGFLGINVLGNSTFHYVDIIGSNALTAQDVRCTLRDISFSERAECQGGNALFVYDDLPYCPSSPLSYTLTLNETYISDGVNPLLPYSILHAELSTAGGLTVIEGQSNYALKLNLISSLFIRNRGNRGGNILIQLPSTISTSSVTIRNCLSFDSIANIPVYIIVGSLDLTDAAVNLRNSSECRSIKERINNIGKRLEVLNIENSNFTLNVGGGISILVVRSYLQLYLTGARPVFVISIVNCTIRGNLALGPITGAASGLAVTEVAYGERQSTELNIVGTVFEKNLHIKPTGNTGNSVHTYVATNRIQSIGKATFRGCTFTGNNYSAILADNSFVFFEGTNRFVNNTSPYGGAFFLSSSARILLKPNAQLIFMNNFAPEKGGAIFVDVSDLTSISHCNVEVFDPNYLQLSELNITMEFVNNSAGKAGDVYYGGILDRCNVRSPSDFHRTNFMGSYTFNFVADFSGQNSSRSLISTDGTKVCLCDDRYDQKICTRQTNNFFSYYPGERFEIFVVVRDQNNNPVPSVVTTSHRIAGKYDFNELTDTSRCSPLTYRLQYIWQLELLFITPSNLLNFEEVSGLIVVVEFLNCSNLTGFTLDSDTKVCTCVPQLQERNMTCNIDTKSITRQPPYWLSNYSNYLLLHDNCPYDYCKPGQVQIVMTEPNTSEQCAFNRYGILCGSCKEGFSQVFGSSKCLKCSNSYLSLLIPFGLAGIALISILFMFNLTTYSGKINGFIFYANIVHIDGKVFFSQGEQNLFKIFISWINLDLGIETCFYHGMGSHTKLWLQFVFPLYLIILLALVAVIHHLLLRVCKRHNQSELFLQIAGTLGRRIIPVLATILLLSYTKLLQVIFTVLSFTHLDYPDGSRAVWLYNGNITFGRGNHLPLLILSLILFVIVILPYVGLLVLFPLVINTTYFESKKIVRYLNRPNPLKNFVDTYLNPYKNKHKLTTHSGKTYPHCGACWPALLLVMRAFHIIVFASTLSDPGVNLFVIIANTFLLVILNLAVGGVYKNHLLTVLETTYLLNIGILAAATAVSNLLGVNHATVVYLSIVIAIITFASAYIYQGLIACMIKYKHNAWCSKLLRLLNRENATIPDLEHNLSIPPNSASREQPKPCVTTTTIEGLPEEEEEEEEEEEIDMAEQQAETAL